MEVEDKSKHLLTINSHLVFGVASAPALWQRVMDQVLHGLSGCFCMLDDMIITGSSEQQHLANLRAVLSRLKEYGLKLNKKSASFLNQMLNFWVMLSTKRVCISHRP